MNRPTPPHWARRLLAWLHPDNTLEEVEGDLDELYVYWYEQAGKTQATLRYLLNVLSVLPPLVRRRQRNHQDECQLLSNLDPDMIRSYLKIAWRNLVSAKLYTLLNIGGLAVVLAVSLILFWWVKDELTFDRFHPNADRIYRVNAHAGMGVDETTGDGSPAPIADLALSQVPGVEAAVRVTGQYDFTTLLARSFAIGQQTFVEHQNDLRYVDENFLTIFRGFRVRYGRVDQPFSTPNSVVITEEVARKYFNTTNAVGKKLTAADSNRVFTVGAVLANLPDNSTIRAKIFFPMSLHKRLFMGSSQGKRMDDNWGNYAFHTYLKLSANTNPALVGQQLTALRALVRKKSKGDFRLQPLTSLHLYQPDGKDTALQQVRMLGLIALLLLGIGCINYINLTTARATRRTREVGIRKAVGAEARQLVGQLLTESGVTMSIALALAVVLVQGLMPFYYRLTGKTLGFSLADPQAWAVLIGTLVLTGLAAGVYPALVIARFNPLQSLRGRGLSVGQGRLRQVLVVTQFCLATGLTMATFVIGGQLRHIRERNLGFSKEHTFTFYAGNKAEVYKRELMGESGVRSVATATDNILNLAPTTNDFDWTGRDPNRTVSVGQLSVSQEFIPSYGIRLVAGRNFDGTPADSIHFMLNETAVRQTGITDPVGKPFSFHNCKGQIIGVVADFHTESARSPVPPLVLFSRPSVNTLVHVRTTGALASQALAAAERLVKRDQPNLPFEYSFLDETYDQMYRLDERMGQLFNFFANIALVVCCLGLFGLTTYTIEQRTKEIGVRKVLGASVLSLVALLSRDFLGLVLLAILIASPLTYYVMNDWLQAYADRIQIEWWVFAWAGAVAVSISVLTVSYQSIKAALVNPVKSLRSE